MMKRSITALTTAAAVFAGTVSTANADSIHVCTDENGATGQAVLEIRDTPSSRPGHLSAIFRVIIPDTPFPGFVHDGYDSAIKADRYKLLVQAPFGTQTGALKPSGFLLDIDSGAENLVVEVVPYKETAPNAITPHVLTCPTR